MRLLRSALALALAARASAVYFFPDTNAPYSAHGQAPLGPGRGGRSGRMTPFPAPALQDAVRPVLETLDEAELREDLWALTSFHTRHAKDEHGRESQRWLLSQIEEISDLAAVTGGAKIEVVEFEHNDFPQRSIIARIHGANSSAPRVLIGAHQDSKNYREPLARAPGADDDGSGTVTILAAFRALARAGVRPAAPVEFHWYAAEEGGLLGSREVARAYHEEGVPVAAMTQFDMTAWVKNGTREVIGIVSSETDIGLVAHHVELAETYTVLPSLVFRLTPHAGSDHMPWNDLGYPAAFLTESHWQDYNPHIHTPNDRIDISSEFSFAHMLHFSRIAVAFAIERGGLAKDA